MTRQRLNVALLAALLATLGLHWLVAVRADTHRGWSPLSNMARSTAAESYAPSGVLPAGQVLQPPPAGTLPRPERELERSPEELLKRGEWVWQTFCQVCHGAGGLGDGPVTRWGVPAPPSLLAEQAVNRSDEATEAIIRDGRRTMPAYADQVPAADRQAVIAWLRHLQEEARP